MTDNQDQTIQESSNVEVDPVPTLIDLNPIQNVNVTVTNNNNENNNNPILENVAATNGTVNVNINVDVNIEVQEKVTNSTEVPEVKQVENEVLVVDEDFGVVDQGLSSSNSTENLEIPEIILVNPETVEIPGDNDQNIVYLSRDELGFDVVDGDEIAKANSIDNSMSGAEVSIIIIFVVLLLVLIGGLVYYFFFYRKNKNNDGKDIQSSLPLPDEEDPLTENGQTFGEQFANQNYQVGVSVNIDSGNSNPENVRIINEIDPNSANNNLNNKTNQSLSGHGATISNRNSTNQSSPTKKAKNDDDEDNDNDDNQVGDRTPKIEPMNYEISDFGDSVKRKLTSAFEESEKESDKKKSRSSSSSNSYKSASKSDFESFVDVNDEQNKVSNYDENNDN